jgi:hypothetical protein
MQRFRESRKYLSLRSAPGRVRTANLQFRRLSLYPVELRVLSIADDDHMAQPDFGKAKKIAVPGYKLRLDGRTEAGLSQLNLALPVRFSIRGSTRTSSDGYA